MLQWLNIILGKDFYRAAATHNPVCCIATSIGISDIPDWWVIIIYNYQMTALLVRLIIY